LRKRISVLRAFFLPKKAKAHMAATCSVSALPSGLLRHSSHLFSAAKPGKHKAARGRSPTVKQKTGKSSYLREQHLLADWLQRMTVLAACQVSVRRIFSFAQTVRWKSRIGRSLASSRGVQLDNADYPVTT